jgi:ABC-type polar amino acid transport system ATPase subunit
LFVDCDALQAALFALDVADVARISPELPLRANLSALDNIALIPLYQRHVSAAESGRQAMALLDQLDHADIATLRDPDMTVSQRFVTQLARALILQRPRLVIDRPGAMLYDVAYPEFIAQLAGRVASTPAWEIYDYNWNQALYPQGSSFTVSA